MSKNNNFNYEKLFWKDLQVQIKLLNSLNQNKNDLTRR